MPKGIGYGAASRQATPVKKLRRKKKKGKK